MWLVSFVKGFFRPTRARIFLFVVVLVLVSLYDFAFLPFEEKPVITNISLYPRTFVIYFLVLPYILSCLIPSLLELRKRKIFRHAKLWEYFRHEKPVFEEEPANEKPATKVQSFYKVPEVPSKPSKSGPAKRAARKKAGKRKSQKPRRA